MRSFVQRVRLGVCTGLLISLLCGSATAQSVLLKPKFETGQLHYVEETVSGTQTMSGGPLPEGGMEMKIHSIYGLYTRVESASAEGATLKLTYDRAGMSLEHPAMGKMNWDSDAPSADPESQSFASIFKPMVGASLTVEVDARGQVKSIKGFQEMLDKMEDSAAGDMFFEQFKNFFTEEQAKANLSQPYAVFFPGKEVKVGDTWSVTTTSPDANFGEVEQTFDCKLEKVAEEGGRKIATVGFTGVAKTGTKKPGTNAAGMIPELQSWSFKGTARLDAGAGLVIGLDKQLDMKMTMTFPSPPDQEAPKMKIDSLTNEGVKVMSEAERKKAKEENERKAKEAAATAASKP